MARIRSNIPRDLTALVDFLDNIDSESKRAKESWPSLNRWQEDVRAYRGESDKPNQPPSIFGVDLISPAIRRKYGLLTESEPTFDIMPRRARLDNTAKMLRRIITSGWGQWNVPMSLEHSGMHLGVFGSTFWRVTWDRKALFGLGDISIPAIDPRHVRVDPRITRTYDLQHADYIVIDSLRSYGEIAAYEPRAIDLIEPSSRISMVGKGKEGFWAGLRGALRSPATNDFSSRMGGQAVNAVPRVYVREYLIKDHATDSDGNPLYPGGRYFIRVGDPGDEGCIINYLPDKRIDRTGNPYFDGMWDLEWLDNVPDPDHPWGRSEVEAVRKLSDAFNRTGNLLVKNWLRNGFPWVIAQSGSLTPQTIQELKDMEQHVLSFIQRGGNEVRREPSVVGEGNAIQMMQLMMTLVDYTIGLADPSMQAANARVEMRSGEQLAGLQQAAQILVRAEARRLEQFLERVGQKIVSRIFQFYKEDRIMTYFAGDNYQQYVVERDTLVKEVQQLGIKNAVDAATRAGEPPSVAEVTDSILTAIKGAWRDFSFNIVPYSSLSQTKTQRAMLKFQLSQAMLIPGSDVLDELGYTNSLEKTAEAVAWNQARQMEGLPPPAPPSAKSGKKK